MGATDFRRFYLFFRRAAFTARQTAGHFTEIGHAAHVQRARDLAPRLEG